MPVGELRVPEHGACRAIERQQVRVVGHHEDALTGDDGAAVRAAARDPFRPRTLEVPDGTPAPGVQCERLVRRRHVHQAVEHHGRTLERAGVRNREDPLRREPSDRVLVDLRQRGVAVAPGITVVRGPGSLRRHLPEARSRLPQKVHARIVGPKLEIVETLPEDLAVERVARGGPDAQPDDGRFGHAALD